MKDLLLPTNLKDHRLQISNSATGYLPEDVAFCDTAERAEVIFQSCRLAPALIGALMNLLREERTDEILNNARQVLNEAVVKILGGQPDYSAARRFVAEGKVIYAIKEVRQISGLGLKDAKDLVESWPEYAAYKLVRGY